VSWREWWKAHTAYCAFDDMNSDQGDLAYGVLFKLVAEMIDGNCCGIFVPGKQLFVPREADLCQNLQMLSRHFSASSRH
jgi:hypothetical protein